MAKKQSVEEKFAKLDQILSDLQKEDLSLEDAFQKYEEGMKLVKECSTSIDTVEKKLQVLTTVGEDAK